MSDVITFTWLDGTQVPYVEDIDAWTGRELRQAEALAECQLGALSPLAFRGVVICMSVARVTGRRIAEVDQELSVGAITRMSGEINEQRRALAARVTQAAADALAAAEAARAERAPAVAPQAPAVAPQAPAVAAPAVAAEAVPEPTGRVVDFTADSTIVVAAADPGPTVTTAAPPAAVAAPAPVAGGAGDGVDGGEVLSPTSAGSVLPA